MIENKESLNTCGCFNGLKGLAPVSIWNRPGLSALVYRVGTHGQFKKTMLNELSRVGALKGLTVREDNDFSTALLDAWAVTADVLTFYQERIANEGFLRTAAQRLSVLQLARLIGYELSPGVAAGAYLAFTVEDSPHTAFPAASAGAVTGAAAAVLQAAPEEENRITIDIGTRVQSIPGQDELPQTFETIEKIEARKEWNTIKPRQTNRHHLKYKQSLLYAKGTPIDLKPGDGLIYIEDNNNFIWFCRAAEVTPRYEHNHTEVKLQLQEKISNQSLQYIKLNSVTQPKPVLDLPMKAYIGKKYNSADFYAEAKAKKFKVSDLYAYLRAAKPAPPCVTTFGIRAAIFGHNAPKWRSLPLNLRYGEYIYPDGVDKQGTFKPGLYKGQQNAWVDDINIYTTGPGFNKKDGGKVYIYLDNAYSKVVKDSWVLLKDDKYAQVYQVADTYELSKTGFTLNAKVTRLTLKVTGDELKVLDKFRLRKTTVYAQSEKPDLAPVPIQTAVDQKNIRLNDWYDGLYKDQQVIICGELNQSRGNHGCEAATIANVIQDLSFEGGTEILLTEGLKNEYVRSTVTINANVALATHGESVSEVLGSGNASQAFQEFCLRQPPLTYVSASTPSGVESTLEVRVNDLLWKEVPSFYGRGPDERIYITRLDNDGKTYVRFGDGITGSRLPSGQENVTASYRKGIGTEGMVKPGQLSLLMTRPFGVKGANNPLAASGAADPEKLEKARQNCPLTVLTLDRVVSLKDFEDFTRAFAGIEKARADWVWDGETRLVYITVAGAKGKAVHQTSALYRNLGDAVKNSGTGLQPFRIESYVSRHFFIKAKIKIDPRYIKEKVIKQVKTTLGLVFSFELRQLAQPVTKSEVLAVIQGIGGVEAVDLDELYLAGAANTNSLPPHLPARPGRWDRQQKQPAPAELLTLNPNGITISLMETKP
jgi:hypothetical protein